MPLDDQGEMIAVASQGEHLSILAFHPKCAGSRAIPRYTGDAEELKNDVATSVPPANALKFNLEGSRCCAHAQHSGLMEAQRVEVRSMDYHLIAIRKRFGLRIAVVMK